MKSLKYIFFFCLLSCSTSKVITDYDDKVNFVNYKTYNIFENAGEGLSELDKKRIIYALDIEMDKLGFTIAENPDFFIDFRSKISESLNNNTIGIGIGGGRRSGGFGLSGGIPIGGKRLLEEITIDLVTPKKEELIWQGILATKIKLKRTPEQKELDYSEMIQKILSKYPPGKQN